MIIDSMHEYISLDGRIINARDAVLPAISDASLYGKGIFTTVAIYDAEPFLWEKHWYRLAENAVRLGIDITELSASFLRNALDAIVTRNGVSEGRARITIFDTSPGSLWRIESAQNARLLVTTAEPRKISDEFRLTVSPYPVNSQSPLAGVKSCNYFENILALNEAHDCGYDEAIRLNERGEIASACMANVFWQRGEQLFTPLLKTGCLAGTTRAFIIENLKCMEVESDLDELKNVDAVYLTSAGIGIVAAAEFSGKKFIPGRSKITSLLPPKKAHKNTKPHEHSFV